MPEFFYFYGVPTRFKGAWSSFKWDNEKTRTISINTNASTSIK